jgi:hypothetical protein
VDIRQLKRDPDAVRAAIAVLPDDRWVAKKRMSIIIPSRYAERGLVDIGSEIYIVAICCFIVDNTYSILNIIAKFRIEPRETNRIKIRNMEYFEFVFEAGDTLVANSQMLKKDTLVYSVYDELIAKGKIPWYYNYLDYGAIFESAKKFSGANVGLNPGVVETLIATLSKDPTNLSRSFRAYLKQKGVKSLAEVFNLAPEYVPLKSVEYASSNTLARVGGSYFDRAVTAAINDPSDTVSPMESVLFK